MNVRRLHHRRGNEAVRDRDQNPEAERRRRRVGAAHRRLIPQSATNVAPLAVARVLRGPEVDRKKRKIIIRKNTKSKKMTEKGVD